MTNAHRIALIEARVRNYRSLKSVDVALNQATVLVGENNSGKTSFLDALSAAIGAGRRLSITRDDIHLAVGETAPPLDRKVTVDILVKPVDSDGTVVDEFPSGSPWTELWGNGISQDDDDNDFVAIRTQFSWDATKGEYTTDRRFLVDWPDSADWESATTKGRASAVHIAPIAIHYMDAQRDIQSELTTRGSFWYRLVSDPGLSDTDVARIEQSLSELNESIISSSQVLSHLQTNLGDLDDAVSCERGQLEITPVARHFRDLNRGMDINFATKGAQSFPLARHGMGTRSLASVLTFRAYTTWQRSQSQGDALHPMLAIEEPEAHLHPQAQRALFALLGSLPGQRIVSTHSPYIASQASIGDIRHFGKNGAESFVDAMDTSALGPDDIRKINRMVLNTRGEILYARGVLLFEGETEEQALPILAEEYWGRHPNTLGLTMVGVGGYGSYLPFLRLAISFGIPWFLLSDGETDVVAKVTAALASIGQNTASSNVCVLPAGQDFEQSIVTTATQQAIIDAFIEHNAQNAQHATALRQAWAAETDPISKLVDDLRNDKTKYAAMVARAAVGVVNPTDRIPNEIRTLFAQMSSDLSIDPASAHQSPGTTGTGTTGQGSPGATTP